MLYSFITSPSKNKINTIYQQIQDSEGAKLHLQEGNGWYFLLKYQNELDLRASISIKENDKHYLIGEIYNLHEIRVILASYDSGVLVSNEVDTVLSLVEYLGIEGLSLIEGNFCMISSLQEGSLRVITDQLGQTRVYSIYGEDFYITTELKTLSLAQSNIFDFHDLRDFHRLRTLYGDQFVPIKNCTRLLPGSVSFIKTIEEAYYLSNQTYSSQSCGDDKYVSQKEAFRLLESTLINSIKNCLKGSVHPMVTISGGLDSGIVSSVISKEINGVNTISIGSNESNEFREASIVSQYIQSRHKEIVLSDEEILFSVVKAIFHNEIFDGVSAEIQAGLFSVYQHVPNNTDVLLTGYGADLIFGGILDDTVSEERVNKVLWQQILRTRWTGEFSLLGAAYHNIKLRNPYWSNRIIACFRDLAPSYKIKNGNVKCLLKSFAIENNLLPQEIISRKKIGIHQGSSIDYIFGRLLSVNINDYNAKNVFTYNLYKAFLLGELSLTNLNSVDLLKKYWS